MLTTNLYIILSGIRMSGTITSSAVCFICAYKEPDLVSYCKKPVMTQETRYFDCAIPFLLPYTNRFINPLKPELNPICYLLALLAHHFLHVSRIRVKSLTIRLLMSYIYGAPILDVSRSHTTTQHSR